MMCNLRRWEMKGKAGMGNEKTKGRLKWPALLLYLFLNFFLFLSFNILMHNAVLASIAEID